MMKKRSSKHEKVEVVLGWCLRGFLTSPMSVVREEKCHSHTLVANVPEPMGRALAASTARTARRTSPFVGPGCPSLAEGREVAGENGGGLWVGSGLFACWRLWGWTRSGCQCFMVGVHGQCHGPLAMACGLLGWDIGVL